MSITEPTPTPAKATPKATTPKGTKKAPAQKAPTAAKALAASKTTTKAKATAGATKSAPAVKLADRPSGLLPKSADFQKAITAIVAKSKEPVTIASVYEDVPKTLKLTAAQLAVTSEGGELVWRQRTRAATTRLRAAGQLVQTGRGTWQAR